MTRIKVKKISFFPVLIYGSESWALNNRVKPRLPTFEMQMHILIKGLKRRDQIRNTETRRRVSIRTLTDVVEVGLAIKR